MEMHFSHNCELSKKSHQACPHCADGWDSDLARRKRVLQLLALIEHPTALPRDAALRIAQELLAWSAQADSNCQDEPVVEPVVAAETRLAAVA
jgi:hypothetical protein